MNETFLYVGLFVFFSSGKKQTNKQTNKKKTNKQRYTWYTGGGSIRLGASEVGI